MSKVLFFDSTLRDGSHAVMHQFDKDVIANYCLAIDDAGMHTIIIGHGNGLGASSLQVGLSKLSDTEMLSTARKNLHNTRLGAFLIPGFGTIKDDLENALANNVDLFCIASHCTEADVTAQHIDYARKNEKDAFGVLMMFHMASKEKLLEEAIKMKSYGAQGVILMDSAGAATPNMVQETISYLVDSVDLKIGFHPHNNLGLAVGNAYIAINEGATIIDGTTCGLGAGAGNMQMEALLALLKKQGMHSIPDLYKVMDAGDKVIREIMPRNNALENVSIISGIAGVFSSFATQVKKASKQFDLDPRDIFMELGEQKVVGGQEDTIIEIAEKMAQAKKNNDEMFQLETLS